MALFIFSLVGLLASAALLWCLAGFTRALKERPKIIGLMIRVENNDASTTSPIEQPDIEPQATLSAVKAGVGEI